jgi:methenyltetrahydromethanopterin cyclohydrolase
MLSGVCLRSFFPEGPLPTSIVVGGKVFLYLDEDGPLTGEDMLRLTLPGFAHDDMASRYVQVLDAYNFDAIEVEKRGTSPFRWVR